MKEQLLRESEAERRRYEKNLEYNAKYKRKQRAQKRAETIQARMESAQVKWEEAAKEASEAPKGSKERKRANARARNWYLKYIKIKDEYKGLKDQNGERAIQGHKQG